MTIDLTVILDNRPGSMADMGEALGRAGINKGSRDCFTGCFVR